jgi:transcriptional regulator with XRE-family HTH domain
MKIPRKAEETAYLKALGKSIRTYRTRGGLTQERLGELADVNPKYIGELERGEKNPSAIVLYRLAVASKVPISAYFPHAYE